MSRCSRVGCPISSGPLAGNSLQIPHKLAEIQSLGYRVVARKVHLHLNPALVRLQR